MTNDVPSPTGDTLCTDVSASYACAVMTSVFICTTSRLASSCTVNWGNVATTMPRMPRWRTSRLGCCANTVCAQGMTIASNMKYMVVIGRACMTIVGSTQQPVRHENERRTMQAFSYKE